MCGAFEAPQLPGNISLVKGNPSFIIKTSISSVYSSTGGVVGATENFIVWNFHDFHENTGFRSTRTAGDVERLRSLWEAFAESEGSRGGLRTISDSKTRLAMSLHDPWAVRIDCGHSWSIWEPGELQFPCKSPSLDRLAGGLAQQWRSGL